MVVGRQGEHSPRSHQPMGSTAARLVGRSGSSVLVVAGSASVPYQRPLVAVDFSAGAQDALGMALKVVGAGKPVVQVFHAYDMEEGASAAEELRRQAELRDKLKGFVGGFAQVPVDWNWVVERGDPRRVIADTELSQRCDLIVVGRHGGTAAAHIVIGSVAEAVARAARCDVLVVHPGRRELGP
jgi:nucleotide-binding universal stress UspA family protein